MEGGELADQGSEPENLLGNLEIVRRLTVSDGSASSPSALTLNGTIHLAYASSRVGGMSVLWQRSNDSGDTFTSSLRLTPLFDRISNIKVTGDSDGLGTVAVVFEAQPLGALRSNVYLVCSADGGAHWGRTTLIAEGSNPDAVTVDGSVFVGMCQRISGDDRFSIVRIDLGTSEAVNGSVLLSFPFRPSIVRMAATDDGLAYALVPDGSASAVIYSSLPFDGEAAAPVPVFSAGKGLVTGLALAVGPSGPVILLSSNEGRSSLQFGRPTASPWLWSFTSVTQANASFGEVSLIKHGDGWFAAWESVSSVSSIDGAELDASGRLLEAFPDLSDGAAATGPVLVDGGNGTAACFWEQEFGRATEIAALFDVAFDMPNLARLMRYVERLEPGALLDRASQADVRSDLTGIADNISAAKDGRAAELIRKALSRTEGRSDAYGFIVLDPSSAQLQSKVAENLRHCLADVTVPLEGYRVSDTAKRAAAEVSAQCSSFAAREDAGTNIDAGIAPAGAIAVEPGQFTGSLSPTDSVDYFSIGLVQGQTMGVTLTPPSGSNFVFYLMDASNNQLAGPWGSGTYTPATQAYWGSFLLYIKVVRLTGAGIYTLNVSLTGGQDRFGVDVGYSNDMIMSAHIPGLVLKNENNWTGVSGGARQANANASFYLNLYGGSYQGCSDYLLSFTYHASENVKVSMHCGDVWIDVGTLPSKSNWWNWDLLLQSDRFQDSLSNTTGMNVQLRFSGAVIVDSIEAVAYSYRTEAEVYQSHHLTGVGLGTGWSVNGGIANGSSLAQLVVTVPDRGVGYMLEFQTSGFIGTVGVAQRVSDTVYKDIGPLNFTGRSASILLCAPSYYDYTSYMTGLNVEIKLYQPLRNLTGVRMAPAMFTDDVGSSADSSANTPGIRLNAADWGASTPIYGGGSFRATLSTSSVFFLEAPVSGTPYRMYLTYQATNAGSVQLWDGSQYQVLGELIVDGNGWHTMSFTIAPSQVYDRFPNGQVDAMIRITGLSTKVDSIIAAPDSDGDGIEDSKESMRYHYSDPECYTANMDRAFTLWTHSVIAVSFNMTIIGTVYLDGVLIFTQTTHDVSRPVIVRELSNGTHTLSASISGACWLKQLVIRSAYALDPLSADTDQDNLADREELIAGTDPTDPDTDNDGLLDGNEKFSYVASTDSFYRIPGHGSMETTVTLPAFSATLDAVYAQVGITHVDASGLVIRIFKVGGSYLYPTIVLAYGEKTLFRSWNILTDFGAAAFQTAGTWNIVISDTSDGGGSLQYFKMQVNGNTDPLNANSDGDGLNDGEEVENGTCPVLIDTDGDNVNDYNEIHGNTACGQATDPLNPDTDDDGYSDHTDLYMGDAMVWLDFTSFYLRDAVYGTKARSVFFTVDTPSYDFATEGFSVDSNGISYVDLGYYIDVPDTVTQFSVTIGAWADNARQNGIYLDDVKLDIGNGPDEIQITYNLFSGSLMTVAEDGDNDGTGGFDAQAALYIVREIKPLSRTIVVQGIDDNGSSYGLDNASGEYRYSADEQACIFYLNCLNDISNDPFVLGINTVIVPRCVLLESGLKDILLGEGSVPSSLAGAVFMSADTALSQSSSHVIAMVSKNVTAAEAGQILHNLTHTAGGDVVGQGMTFLSTASIYQLHLPVDVLHSIPVLGLMSSNVGAAVVYHTDQGVLQTFFGLITLAYDCLVWAVSSFVNYAAHAVGEGLKFLGQIVNGMAAAIVQAAEAMVDAFNAFVTWAIEFIQNSLNTIFGPIIDSIKNAINDYCAGISSAWMKVNLEFRTTGTVSPSTARMFGDALQGTLFLVLLAISVVIKMAMIALMVVTNVFGFLINLAVSQIAGIIVNQALSVGNHGTSTSNSIQGVDSSGNVNMSEYRSSLDASGINTSGNGTSEDTSKWSAFWSIMGILSAEFAIKIGYGAWHDSGLATMGYVGLALSGISLALSCFAFSLTGSSDFALLSKALNFVSFFIGLSATMFSVYDLFANTNAVGMVSTTTSLAATMIAFYGLKYA